MSLREATVDDVAVIGYLIRGLAEYEKLAHEVVWDIDELRANLFGEHSTTRVTLAVDDATGEVAGFALWFPTFSTFRGDHGIYLEDLFVKPEFRGGGHGLALLNDLRARTNGRVEWMVLDWNEPSIRFYDALGAEPVPGWIRYRWLPPST
jgi:GNAT superfamily N-acetyltransferase